MSFTLRVECPRCHRIHIVHQGIDEVDCNCHLFCPYGDDPSDCSVTPAVWTGEPHWPTGIHNDPAQEGENIKLRTYYCSTHDKYYYKKPIMVPVDWSVQRVVKKLRNSLGDY